MNLRKRLQEIEARKTEIRGLLETTETLTWTRWKRN